MKLPLKIALISLAVVCVLSATVVMVTAPQTGKDELLIGLGLGCLLGGCISVIVSIVFFIGKSREWGKGFLLGAGLLLLVGFATCTGGVVSGFNP
jgi:peptidoglycan biosynthesis protein MviN/MurJ (putative lipid II flippase)